MSEKASGNRDIAKTIMEDMKNAPERPGREIRHGRVA
ncbi:MAG TPA: hypothetical protein DEF41_14590 [Desulfovibrio sp.]|uniref:Uncharacterized protein n=1 Tax=Nitratidesulfovibrio vulgaris (strain ATCC 29579 / DSM 644 / CCUG 34227 / NCIMB 8303 / VKM B-1760 / Hildenborough) TaxID=882 RepID=Q729C2_NITV2|nr:hypothetical protein DVU_2429 [Nitratidesulfovibrio vulgaris str. Hildenborough]HBW17308.1 hypothetical protein [Desulfovibrio sp.]